jgi:hypothetical protein
MKGINRRNKSLSKEIWFMIDDIKWSLMKEEDTNPNRMKIHWKTMATCDKDYCQLKKMIAQAKRASQFT